MSKREQTYYDILEISHTASDEEIHKAFLKAKNTYSSASPALYSVFSEEEADELRKMIDEAYAVLGHGDRRKRYDEKLLSGEVEPKKVETINNSSQPLAKKTFEKNESMEREIAEQSVFDGSFLQKIRNYKNIHLEEMCQITRIGRHYLVALESNDFHALPAQVFVRGFVVQVAKTLGLEHNKVADSYMKLYKSSRESN